MGKRKHFKVWFASHWSRKGREFAHESQRAAKHETAGAKHEIIFDIVMGTSLYVITAEPNTK